MNCNVSLNVEIESLAELGPLEKAIAKIGKLSSINIYTGEECLAGPIAPPVETTEADPEYEEVEPPEAVDEVAAAKAKKSARAKERRAEKAAAKAAETEEVDPLAELTEGDAAEADAAEDAIEEPTEDDLKAAAKVAIEKIGIDDVRALFLNFKGKNGKPCAKMNDVKPKDIGKVIAALKKAGS